MNYFLVPFGRRSDRQNTMHKSLTWNLNGPGTWFTVNLYSTQTGYTFIVGLQAESIVLEVWDWPNPHYNTRIITTLWCKVSPLKSRRYRDDQRVLTNLPLQFHVLQFYYGAVWQTSTVIPFHTKHNMINGIYQQTLNQTLTWV